MQPGMQVREKLQQLELDAEKVGAIERERFAKEPPGAPWWIQGPYYALCYVLDVVYEGRPIERFWVLEEVARMPYFAYLSMLHMYESLGWWRAGAALRRVHFSEEWNELHHLQVCCHSSPFAREMVCLFGHVRVFYGKTPAFLKILSVCVARTDYGGAWR